MIQGTVNAELEPTVPIVLLSPSGKNLPLTAILHTGFTGSLALPLKLAEELGLQPLDPRSIRLGDGSRKRVRTFAAMVEWFGLRQRVRVIATKSEVLIGLRLLENLRLDVRFRSGDPLYLG